MQIEMNTMVRTNRLYPCYGRGKASGDHGITQKLDTDLKRRKKLDFQKEINKIRKGSNQIW